jgi:hypothetical protein
MATAGNGISIQEVKHIKPANRFSVEHLRNAASCLARISMDPHVCGLLSSYIFHVLPDLRADP